MRYCAGYHRSYFVAVIVVVYCAVADGLFTKEFQKNIPAKQVWAVAGKDAELPCDITPALPGDNVTMIFWYKDGMGMPLYSLDARFGPVGQATHFANTDNLGARTQFITDGSSSKARLKIERVTEQDQGVFRCRVDFVNSPTRNFRVNLTLVVQPSAPKVFDAEGQEIRISAPAGPFLEGHELFLSCQVDGGFPKPSVTWWYNGTILDGVIDSERSSYTTVNQLEIKSTPRYFKGAHLQCRASSSELAGYVSRDIPLIVFLKPNKVKIVTPNELLSTRKSQTVRCETSGSYPPAKLTWLLDGKPIRNGVVTEEETDSFTGSILALNVSPDDDGKELLCRADNPRFPGGSAEDRRQIHVAYAPKVTVRVEWPSSLTSIKEDMNVTLKCETSARPKPYSYSWYLDSHLIPYNETAGVLPMDQILQLRNVKQNFGGNYACSAINSEGETYSAPLELKVHYAPRCRSGYEIRHIGAVAYETIAASCLVEAYPEVTRFTWTYNTSNGVLPVQSGKMDNTGNSSMLLFTPKEGDVESLACWARNSIGSQSIPCLFYIVPAEVPETPKSCIVKNTTQPSGILEVSCIAGKDGGLHQSFVLEVSDVTAPVVLPGVTTMSDQGELPPPIYRVMGDRPVFRLPNLEPAREYRLAVYAENAKGRSYPPALLPGVRVEPFSGLEDVRGDNEEGSVGNHLQAIDTSQPRTGSNLTIIIISAATISVVLIVSIISAATVLACRRSAAPDAAAGVRRRGRRSSKPPDEFDLSEDGFGEGFHRRSAQYRASMYGECEDRITRMIEGPDLILAPYTTRSSQNLDI